MMGDYVTIIKDGAFINITEADLHKDDLIVLQAGDEVPADIRLVEARELEVDEFDITGEIMPVRKRVEDENKILYSGSRLLRGAAKGIVFATGEQTEYGKVLEQQWEEPAPYKFKIIKTRYLGFIILLLPALILYFSRSNQDVNLLILIFLGVVLLVLLQSEDLFRSFLITKEQKRLASFDIQIRDVNVLTRLRHIDLICFDKTGVLTTRHMEVKMIYIAGIPFEPDKEWSTLTTGETEKIVTIACALCNDIQFYQKVDLANSVDKALISFAERKGIDIKNVLMQYQRIYDVPFNSENRYMACGFQQNGEKIYFLKGDPDVVLQMCSHYVTATGAQRKLDWDFFRLNALSLDAINQNGNTAIALAYTTETHDKTIPGSYTFLCLLQLENPLQPGASSVVEGIKEHGIRNILLTGDKAKTAVQVGAACGITTGSRSCLIGRVIDRMGATELTRQSEFCSVYAQLLPSQKGYLVRLLQLNGHHVAMIGDGPNDGIALKAAEIGISFVDNSSPIARRLAKILITDLTDLLRVVESANKIERQSKHLRIVSITAIFVLLLCLYVALLK